MMLPRIRLVSATVALAMAGTGWIQRSTPSSPAHRFERVADGIYAAISNGRLNTGANAAVIVNSDDVVIVDPGITPAAGRALIDDIKTITLKPVRYVVDTHYHFDHAHGNQVFGADVQIIGHEFTRQMLLTNVLQQQTFRMVTDPLPTQIENLTKQVASEADRTKKSELEARLGVQQAYVEALKEVQPTPPNVTFPARLTLYRGDREIQLHFMGRAHTGGDVIVYLPRERIVCTGDVMTNMPTRLSYMGDGFVNEWPETLENVSRLDFETVIPGHGEPFKGKDNFRYLQAVLRDLWTQASDLRKKGYSAEEAAKKVDLTPHSAHVPQIRGTGIDVNEMARMYDVMQGRSLPR
jgi:glyoxylase-like metal-dependent hydrolase (beta-lactamase superfamily II)